MGVNLDQDEIDEFLRDGHTVTVSTIDKDGYPHSTPLWYAYLDGEVYFRKLKKSQGAVNIARNDKVCCLVETGEAWIDLKAVMIRGRAVPVTDEATIARFLAENERKYAPFRTVRAAMPGKTQQHYAQERVVYRVVPEKKIVSFWNRKLRFPGQPPAPTS